jgi:hypothetical protein
MLKATMLLSFYTIIRNIPLFICIGSAGRLKKQIGDKKYQYDLIIFKLRVTIKRFEELKIKF